MFSSGSMFSRLLKQNVSSCFHCNHENSLYFASLQSFTSQTDIKPTGSAGVDAGVEISDRDIKPTGSAGVEISDRHIKPLRVCRCLDLRQTLSPQGLQMLRSQTGTLSPSGSAGV